MFLHAYSVNKILISNNVIYLCYILIGLFIWKSDKATASKAGNKEIFFTFASFVS